jgi:hypothetical protein
MLPGCYAGDKKRETIERMVEKKERGFVQGGPGGDKTAG